MIIILNFVFVLNINHLISFCDKKNNRSATSSKFSKWKQPLQPHQTKEQCKEGNGGSLFRRIKKRKTLDSKSRSVACNGYMRA